MNCPFCNAENDKDNLFCVSCGKNFAAPAAPPAPTVFYKPGGSPNPNDAPASVQTVFKPAPAFNAPTQSFDNPPIAYAATPPAREGGKKLIWLGAIGLCVLLASGIGAFFLINRQPAPTAGTESLPDHLGLFLQDKEKNTLAELARQDSTNALQTKDDLLKNESLPATAAQPYLILYSDGKDIPLGDLKLVQLDTIKDDGTIKQINFQAAPVEGKMEMKRLRVPDSLANGKYAFALFDGFLDEGKHKFWAFQVKNAQKSDNGDLAKAFSLSMKPKTASPANADQTAANTATVKLAPTPKPAPSAPAGAQVAYCKSNNITMRSSPSLDGRKVNALKRGQKIYIINYSENYDYWNGMEGNWAYVQTESGSRGWVFSPLIGSE